MLGYNSMKEVAIWCQFEIEGDYLLEFRKENDLIQIQEFASEENANTTHFILKNLLPATSYTYSIKKQNESEVLSEGDPWMDG